MASKWLAAFRETEDVPLSVFEKRAVSADSANSPPHIPEDHPIGTIGTIGTAEEISEQAESPEADIEERAALIEDGANVPRRWAEGFAALSTMAAPAGFSPERWQRIVDAAGTFLDRWAFKAIECRWSDLDVFGADPDRPDARFDCMGLVLLLDRMEVVGIDADGADLRSPTGGAMQRYRRRPLPAHAVSLWQLH